MLGIAVALPWELKSLTHETIVPGSWKAIAPQTLVAISGMGADLAREAAALLIAQGATALMSWGYAAALDDRLSAGCLALPERVIGAGGENYPVDTQWHERLYLASAFKFPVWTGALVESESVVATAAEKLALKERTGAAAADMESAAHARVAAERGVRYVSVRAVVDTASTEIPEAVLQARDARGGIDIGKLLGACGGPAAWMKVVRLATQFCAAQKTLKRAKRFALDSSPL
ncbi:MAG TPA: phosphorylase [Candidatus Binatia bacterium]|jgi:nucleoside phosphorylase